jgi:predicted N-acyltransferase
MPDGADAITVKVLSSIHDAPAAAWDACAGTDNPFLGHDFLAALEDSGSVCAETGWLPRHLCVFDAHRRLLATMPLYLKSHSYGEYVFDWSWAEAYERAGGRYYPKLQAAVPFTPVPGRRLLVRPDASKATFGALAATAVRLAERLGVSSLHVTFPTEPEIEALRSYGFLVRLGYQFHWENRGYASFEDFLSNLASRKRKAVRKERQSVAASGIVLRTLNRPEIEERHWDAFWRFYLDTADRKWGHPYLNRAFFRRLGETMADRVVLVMAEAQGGEPVGGALNLLGRDAIYGRYWGSTEACRFLHFEACYYRAIDFAIEHGLARVEAGAQGEHKVQRGYLPQPTWSAHWIAPPELRRAVQRFLAAERPAVEARIRALMAESPFRREDS